MQLSSKHKQVKFDPTDEATWMSNDLLKECPVAKTQLPEENRRVCIYRALGKQKLGRHHHCSLLNCSITACPFPYNTYTHATVSEGNPVKRHLRKDRYGRNVVSRQLQAQQCQSEDNTHIHSSSFSRWRKNSLGEKSPTHQTVSFSDFGLRRKKARKS